MSTLADEMACDGGSARVYCCRNDAPSLKSPSDGTVAAQDGKASIGPDL